MPILISLSIFIRCPVSSIFYSGINKLRYYCCVELMIVTASMITSGNLGGSSISLKLASTKDLNSCLIMLLVLPTTVIFLYCATRRISIEILNGLSNDVVIASLSLPLRCRKSFNHTVREMLLPILIPSRLQLQALLLWSLFYLS